MEKEEKRILDNGEMTLVTHEASNEQRDSAEFLHTRKYGGLMESVDVEICGWVAFRIKVKEVGRAFGESHAGVGI